MQESVIVIFIIIVLILLGFIFFWKFTSISILNQVNEYEEYKFNQLINVIPNMPEIKCSHLGREMECVDVTKLGTYIGMNIKNKDFNNKNITIKEMYLPNPNTWQMHLDEPKSYNSVFVVSSPVSLYYPLQDRYGFGLLILEWYR